MKFEIEGTAITIVPDPVHGSQMIQIQATDTVTIADSSWRWRKHWVRLSRPQTVTWFSTLPQSICAFWPWSTC